MAKVNPEVARAEFNEWLDAKRYSKSKREKPDTSEIIDSIVEAICDGTVTINTEDKASPVLVQSLSFPVGDNQIKELKFALRVNAGVVQAKLREMNVKGSDIDGRLIAYISATTGEVAGTIRGLDTIDFSLASGIATFFM